MSCVCLWVCAREKDRESETKRDKGGGRESERLSENTYMYTLCLEGALRRLLGVNDY